MRVVVVMRNLLLVVGADFLMGGVIFVFSNLQERQRSSCCGTFIDRGSRDGIINKFKSVFRGEN
jgi:hypothetical protein